MTRSIGITVHGSPCCGNLYRSVRYASISWHGEEQWSDGSGQIPERWAGGGFCQCPTCGHYFHQRDCIEVAVLSEDEYQQGPYADLPALPELADEALAGCLQHPFSRTSAETEIFLRRRYWRFLNTTFRGHYRHCMSLGHPERIVFNPTSEQRANMERLLQLLEQHTHAHWLERAELHHELGNPEQALACLAMPDIPDTRLRDWMRAHITEGGQGPFRFEDRHDAQPVEPVSTQRRKPWWQWFNWFKVK